jgi:hypothetical protein
MAGPGARNERAAPRVGHDRAKPGATVQAPTTTVKRSEVRPAGSLPGKAGELHRPGATTSGLAREQVAPKTTAMPKFESRALPQHSPTELASLQANPLHNRGPGPAAIGGLTASSAARSTAALNGTGFTHKR